MSSNPNEIGGWSEEQMRAQLTDRRAILSTSHGSLAAGEEITQTYAFVYYRNGSRLQNLDGMQLAVQELHSYYDSIAYGDCSIAVASLEEEKSKNLKVYPNPVDNVLSIDNGTYTDVKIKFFDVTGNQVKSVETTSASEIYVGDLTNGSYHLIIESNIGKTHKYLVVNH